MKDDDISIIIEVCGLIQDIVEKINTTSSFLSTLISPLLILGSCDDSVFFYY